MEIKYRLEFGKETNMLEGDMTLGRKQAVWLISEDQFHFIESVADVEIDSEMNKWYKINRLVFRCRPHFPEPQEKIKRGTQNL